MKKELNNVEKIMKKESNNIKKNIIKIMQKVLKNIIKNIIRNIRIKRQKKLYNRLKSKQKPIQINIITLKVKRYMVLYIQFIILNPINIMQGKQLEDSIIDILQDGYLHIVIKILLNMIWSYMGKTPLNTLRYSKQLIHSMNWISQKHITLIIIILMKMVIMKIEGIYLLIEGRKNNLKYFKINMYKIFDYW